MGFIAPCRERLYLCRRWFWTDRYFEQKRAGEIALLVFADQYAPRAILGGIADMDQDAVDHFLLKKYKNMRFCHVKSCYFR